MSLPATLAALPRDTRDTLFLLLVIALCVAPLIGHIPPWASALTGVLLLWRGLLAWRARPLPGRGLRVLLLVLAVVAPDRISRPLTVMLLTEVLFVPLTTIVVVSLEARRRLLKTVVAEPMATLHSV